MQVTKGTWRMREQCVPGYLSSSPAQEPGNEASTSRAPALEMHSAQVLEMLVQMQCPRNVQGVSKSCKKCFVSKRVLQNSYVIQWCPRSVQVVKFQRAKWYACADTDLACVFAV